MDAYESRSYFFFSKLSQALPFFSDSTMSHNMGYKFHKTLCRFEHWKRLKLPTSVKPCLLKFSDLSIFVYKWVRVYILKCCQAKFA